MGLVTVRFFATFREVSGEAEATVDAEDVEGLLALLQRRHGAAFSRLVRRTGPDAFVVLVNGRNVARLSGMRTRLEEGDEVALFPPVSGG